MCWCKAVHTVHHEALSLSCCAQPVLHSVTEGDWVWTLCSHLEGGSTPKSMCVRHGHPTPSSGLGHGTGCPQWPQSGATRACHRDTPWKPRQAWGGVTEEGPRNPQPWEEAVVTPSFDRCFGASMPHILCHLTGTVAWGLRPGTPPAAPTLACRLLSAGTESRDWFGLANPICERAWERRSLVPRTVKSLQNRPVGQGTDDSIPFPEDLTSVISGAVVACLLERKVWKCWVT